MTSRSAANTQRFLITGARGFVGGHVRAAIAARYPTAKVTCLASAGNNSPGFVTADLLDPAKLDMAVARAEPNTVIHLAAQASVARSLDGGSQAFAVNLGGSLNLALSMARHAPTATLLFASSSEVYGAALLGGPASESSPVLPLSDYARSKLLAEQMFASVLPASVRLLIARPFNHTGPGQSEDFAFPSFAAQIARIEAGCEKVLRVGNLDVRRDVQDVRDVASAYLDLIEAAPNLPSRFTCNIASGQAHALRIWLETMCSFAQCPIEIITDPARVRTSDIPVACGCSALIRIATGWHPRYSFSTTLFELLSSARASVAGGTAR